MSIAKPAGQASGIVKFLIAEIDPITASHIHSVLEDCGIEIAGVVGHGATALALAAREPVAIALVGVRLRGRMAGPELARTLLARHGTRTIFIADAALDAETREAARAARPLGFVHKPFRPSELFNLLVQIFGPPPELPSRSLEQAL